MRKRRRRQRQLQARAMTLRAPIAPPVGRWVRPAAPRPYGAGPGPALHRPGAEPCARPPARARLPARPRDRGPGTWYSPGTAPGSGTRHSPPLPGIAPYGPGTRDHGPDGSGKSPNLPSAFLGLNAPRSQKRRKGRKGSGCQRGLRAPRPCRPFLTKNCSAHWKHRTSWAGKGSQPSSSPIPIPGPVQATIPPCASLGVLSEPSWSSGGLRAVAFPSGASSVPTGPLGKEPFHNMLAAQENKPCQPLAG